MKVRRLWIALLPVILAGCQGDNSSADQAMSNSIANSIGTLQNKLEALPAPSRNGVFLRAIGDAGYNCQIVEKAEPHAPVKGRPAWSILCDHHTPFVAIVGPNDYLQVVPGRIEDTTG